MSAIGPNDWVEAVRTVERRTPNLRQTGRLVAGSVHLVARVFEALGTCGECGTKDPTVLVLPGTSEGGTGWCPCAVRPINRPKADFLESLLTPADAPSEREGVDA